MGRQSRSLIQKITKPCSSVCHFAQSSSTKSISRNSSVFRRVTNVHVCLSCTTTEHKSHEIEVLDKAAHDEKPNIKAGAEMVEEKIEELNEAIRQFGETSAELKHNFAEVKQEVSETAKRMIEKIQERERVVIESPRGDAQEERKEDYLG